MTKIIFLDIDGVLNGYSRLTGILYHSRFIRKRYDIFGVHFFKVMKLALLVHLTGAKVVLTSSWRLRYFNTPKWDKNMIKLKKLFNFFKIEVVGITPKPEYGKTRGMEIREWIFYYYHNLTDFVIFDDEVFDIKDMYPDNLIATRSKKVDDIKGMWYENTGLKLKHVVQAYKILNKDKEIDKSRIKHNIYVVVSIIISVIAALIYIN